MARVLRAPFTHVYQLGLLRSELDDILASAPPIPVSGAPDPTEGTKDKRKKVEGDCPICFMDLLVDGKDTVVWCRAACGQNFHTDCFQTWARIKGSTSSHVTCPLCRSPWEGSNSVVGSLNLNQAVRSEGYINVADQLGISRMRGMVL